MVVLLPERVSLSRPERMVVRSERMVVRERNLLSDPTRTRTPSRMTKRGRPGETTTTPRRTSREQPSPLRHRFELWCRQPGRQ
jgi:hypothetical protein